MIAIFCSVPFKKEVDEAALRNAFMTGAFPDDIKPYLDRAINEMPIEMIAQAVNSFESDYHATVIKNIQAMADYFGATQRISSWMNCG